MTGAALCVVNYQATPNEIEAFENIFRLNAHVFPRMIETEKKMHRRAKQKACMEIVRMEWPSGSLSSFSSIITVDCQFRNAHLLDYYVTFDRLQCIRSIGT